MPDYDVLPFDPHEASDEDFVALFAFAERTHAEAWPDDPPLTLEDLTLEYRGTVAFLEVQRWLARLPSGDVIAEASLGYRKIEENRHLANAWIGVLPERRRGGVAKELMARIAEAAATAGRTVLMFPTSSAVPSGEGFAKRLGAKMGMAAYTNQLDLQELDRALVQEWLNAGASQSDFALGLWDGPFPEEDLEAVAELGQVMNGAPRDDLDMEDTKVTPQQIRQYEEAMEARGFHRWMMYVRERATGRLAGYTEVRWNPRTPTILAQGDTGVWPEYRLRGLGKWLKAAMLDKVIRERPEVRFVRTGNAQSNAPMLRINHQLGFRPYREIKNWQVGADQVREYLDGGGV